MLPSVKTMIEPNMIFVSFVIFIFYLFLLRQVKEQPIEVIILTLITIIKSIEANEIFFFISSCSLFLRVIETFRRACATCSTTQHSATCCNMFHNKTQRNMLRGNVANNPEALILFITFSALVSPGTHHPPPPPPPPHLKQNRDI